MYSANLKTAVWSHRKGITLPVCQRSTWTLCECVKTIKRKAPPFPLLYFKESWYEEGPGALISSREHRGEGFNLYFGSLLVYACTDAPTTILFAEASMNPSITVL